MLSLLGPAGRGVIVVQTNATSSRQQQHCCSADSFAVLVAATLQCICKKKNRPTLAMIHARSTILDFASAASGAVSCHLLSSM